MSDDKNQGNYYIDTWGCQMNVADSEQMAGVLQSVHYNRVDKPEEADLIVLNTCHIREKARHKVVSRLGVLRALKEKKPGMTIAVAGCVAQAEGKNLFSASDAVDIVLGPGRIDELPGIITEQKKTQKSLLALGHAADKKELVYQSSFDQVTPFMPKLSQKVSRFLTIQQGCDNFCTFCVVPFTRGREISVRPEEVYQKAFSLVEKGDVREIFLLGQNVNSYGSDLVRDERIEASKAGPFVDLLRRLIQIPKLVNLRFTTSNPHDLTEDIAHLFAESPKLGKYYHLPVQSGSDSMLVAMRRKVTVNEYLEKVSWLRNAVSGMSLSTDLIIGFPGETDEDFQRTVDLVEKVKFDFIYAFKYSPRKGTAASRMRKAVSEKEKSLRLAELNRIQKIISLDIVEKNIGCEEMVLFQYPCIKKENAYYGRTASFRLVRVESKLNLVGCYLPVLLTGGNTTAMVGELLS